MLSGFRTFYFCSLSVLCLVPHGMWCLPVSSRAHIKFLLSCRVLCLALSLHDASVDAVLSDIPFGAKHGTVDGVRQLLPKLVPSIHRCVNRCIYVACMYVMILTDDDVGWVAGRASSL